MQKHEFSIKAFRRVSLPYLSWFLSVQISCLLSLSPKYEQLLAFFGINEVSEQD